MHNPNAPAGHACTYTKVKSDGYGATWRTACGQTCYCETPCEVGICFPPLPNDHGRTFCTYCGGVIALNPPNGRGEALTDAAFARKSRAAFAQHIQSATDHPSGGQDDEQPPR